MKFLVTGATGQLGKALCNCLAGTDFLGTNSQSMDIADRVAIERVFSSYCPDVVIHGAAFTNVDGAETNSELAFRLNALGTQNVACACQKYNAAMVYVTSDYIFDGKSGCPYDEYDLPAPLNVYGKSKAAGEAIARQFLNRLFVVRTSWLFGDGNNFVRTILRQGYQNQSVKIVNDQFGCPTYAADVAEAIIKLIHSDYYGVYHVVNRGITTWYDFAAEIFSSIGKVVDLQPLSTAELGRPARRPLYSALNDNLFRLVTGHEMRSWQESLRDYMENDPVIRKIIRNENC